MSIRRMQARFATVGAIRLGDKARTKSGKLAPNKINTFRITVRDRELADAIASEFGGEPRPWNPDHGKGGWEVYTEVTELPVYVIPQKIDPNYELWGPGVMTRKCDGQTESIRGCGCMCEAQARATAESRGESFDSDAWWDAGGPDPQRGGCKPTTRISLALGGRIPLSGVFKLESHGWNAAVELSNWSAVIEMASVPIQAKLVLDQREKKRITFKNGREVTETLKFAVPVLDFGPLQLTAGQAFGGAIDSAAKRVNQLSAPETTLAIESSVSGQMKADSGQWIELIEECTTIDELEELSIELKNLGVRGRSIVEAWKMRYEELSEVEAEIEPDKDHYLELILEKCQADSISESRLSEMFTKRFGHEVDSDQTTGFQLKEILESL